MDDEDLKWFDRMIFLDELLAMEVLLLLLWRLRSWCFMVKRKLNEMIRSKKMLGWFVFIYLFSNFEV